jgi:hypothetical protein
MDSIGKKCLHGFIGAIVGFGIGAFAIGSTEHFLFLGIIGAIFCGFAAFFLADEFWKVLRDYF